MKEQDFLPQLKSWVRRDFPTMKAAQQFFDLHHSNYLSDMFAGRRKVSNKILEHYGYELVVSREYVER